MAEDVDMKKDAKVEAAKCQILFHWVLIEHTHATFFLKYYPLPSFFNRTQNLPVWAPGVMHSVAGKYLALQLSCFKGQHSLLHTVHSLHKAFKPTRWIVSEQF